MHVDLYNVLIAALGILTTVITFFLMRTMSKLDTAHEIATQNRTEIAILKKEFDLSLKHINEKLDGIKGSIDELKKR